MNAASPLSASIAMCTYNGEKYIEKQLDSFLNQTILPNELIVCDDGSTDNTISILNQFANRAPFSVKIYQNETNLGYVKNFEKAGMLCSKDIVYFSDQDDIWFPDKNEKTLNLFASQPQTGLVLLNAILIDEEDNEIPFPYRIRKKQKAAAVDIEPYRVIESLHHWIASWQGCNMAYRNSLRDRIYPVHSEIGHDQWILLLLGVLSETHIIHSPTLKHRIHNSNASRLSTQAGNLFARAWLALQRHQSPTRYRQKSNLFHNLLARTESFSGDIRHDELIPVFQRFEDHLKNRAEALERVSSRGRIILSELANGNYAFCSKGLKDALSDFLAWPQSRAK